MIDSQATAETSAVQTQAPGALLPEQVEFTGSGGEYFRIWIVNLLLSLLTLGIYSAWAKVRRLKYFSRSTALAGARFDYHGDPIAILKGRFIAIALFIAYQYAFDVSLTVGLATLALLAVVMPWLLRNSFRFRMHNTSYRGIRFAFTGSQEHAYYVFLVGGIASVLSLYFALPFFHQRLKSYQHGNAWYGRSRFSFSASPGAFYAIYAKAFGIVLLGMMLMGVAVAVLAGPWLKSSAAAGGNPQRMAVLVTSAVFAIYALVILFIAPYFGSRIQNLVWNNTMLDRHRFACTLSARRLLWIYITNLLGVIVTLGFFMPWASVRLARYKAQCLQMLPAESLDLAVAGDGQNVGAAGQETADFFDIDIAL